MAEFPVGPQGTLAARIFRVVLRLILLLILAYGVHLLIAWFSARTADIHPSAQVSMLVTLLLVYALLIAVPFVPGIEIGLMLLAVEGAWIAPWLYLATVAGLLLAYAAGEWVPYARLHRILADLHLRRACALLEHIDPLSREERIMLLRDNAPKWLRALVSRYRYLFLAAAINLPGNAVIGGGGGILFLAGPQSTVQARRRGPDPCAGSDAGTTDSLGIRYRHHAMTDCRSGSLLAHRLPLMLRPDPLKHPAQIHGAACADICMVPIQPGRGRFAPKIAQMCQEFPFRIHL